MVDRSTLARVLLGREVAVAFAVLAAVYLVRVIRFQPLQIPAYLLIVAYDVVEVVLPVLTPYHPIGFPAFLYLLAVVGAGAARWLRSADDGVDAPVRAVAGVCLIVGSISLLFAALVGGQYFASTDDPTPMAITGTTGLVLLAAAWWLLGRPRGPFLTG